MCVGFVCWVLAGTDTVEYVFDEDEDEHLDGWRVEVSVAPFIWEGADWGERVHVALGGC